MLHSPVGQADGEDSGHVSHRNVGLHRASGGSCDGLDGSGERLRVDAVGVVAESGAKADVAGDDTADLKAPDEFGPETCCPPPVSCASVPDCDPFKSMTSTVAMRNRNSAGPVRLGGCCVVSMHIAERALGAHSANVAQRRSCAPPR